MSVRFVAATLLAILMALLTAPGCSKSQQSGRSLRNDGKITGSSSDPPVTFQALWDPTNRYIFHSEITTSADIPRQGVAKPQPQASTLGLDYAITVSNVRSNGGRSLEMEITSIQFDASMGETTLISYDSQNKVVGTDGNPMAERLEKIIGNKITFQISPSNKVSNVKGITEITDKLNNGGTARGQTLLRRLFTPQYLRHLIDLTVVPSDPVRIDEKWPGQMALNPGPLVGVLTGDVTYTFRGWQMHDGHKCALVEFSGTVKPRNATAPQKGSISSTLESGSITGKSWFDPNLGMVVESMSDQTANSKGSIKFRRATTNAPPQMFTSTLHQHASIKLLEVEPAKAPN